MSFTLYIGNKAFSSWSLRGWLALKATGVAFTEAEKHTITVNAIIFTTPFFINLPSLT